MPRFRRTRTLATAIAILTIGGGGAIDAGIGHAAKPKHLVKIKGTVDTGWRFAPKKLTIKKGQTVHWSWNSDADHNVYFSEKRQSKIAPAVKDFKLKFKKKGTFKYTCTVHGFGAKIVVK